MAHFHSSRIVTDGLSLLLDAANPKNYNLTSVEVLVVAGGGGGGMDMGGGGGGGGVIYNPNVTVTPGSSVTVTVGAGGYGAPAGGGGYRTDGAGPQPNFHQFTIPATNGGNSVFGSLTAIGGGAGGSSYRGYTPGIAGANGGSGGGASGYNDNAGTFSGGTGTSGQGFAGGNSTQAYRSGGGGGAGGPGVSSPDKPNGGPGVLYPTISPYYFGGGGGGASYSLSTGGDGGIGGGGGGAVGTTYGGAGLNNGSPGGGGSPNSQTNQPGGNAGANTGGGGGGGSHYNSNNKGGEGGSGIVIVRYQGPQKAIGGTVTSVNGYTLHTFTTVGSTTFTPLVATNNSAIIGLSDFSGNNNFGTSANGIVYSSDNSGILVFDGTNDRVDLGTNFSSVITGTNSFSIECWVYPENTQVPYADIWGNHTDNVTGIVMQQNATTLNQFEWGWGNGSAWETSGASGLFNLNTQSWNHIIAIRDGSNIYTYLNSTLVNTASNSSNVVPNTSFNFQIGTGYNLNSSRYFNGKISNFKIYNRALTSSEILQNYNASKGRFGL